jgi:hypothetical protein
MSGSTARDENRGRETATNAAGDRGGKGWMFVDLVTAVDDAMHEVAHAFPAVDHRSHLPTRPTNAELDRIDDALRASESAELHAAFASWRRRDEEFAEAAHRLEQFDGRSAEPGATDRSELERRIDEVRERRARVGEAAEDLRRQVARELETALRRARVG